MVASEKVFRQFIFYVADKTNKTIQAIVNLKKICKAYLHHNYLIQVVDLIEDPSLVARDQIFAVLIFVRKLPEPICSGIPDLFNTEKVLVALAIK